ncbi:MAG TPA: hypothetical protein VLZ89_00200 [Anaerolineales bacterium]|nr:hypothetical protein [Anaerolineales bacterium]
MEQEMLSQEYLDEVRKRCEAATAAPWISFVEGRDFTGGDSVIGRGPNRSEADLYLTGETIADQDFIAHARQDVPLLLAEIARLRSKLSTLGRYEP